MKIQLEENKENLTFSMPYRSIFLLGGLTCTILVTYSLLTILIMTLWGTPPENITECYKMLAENRFLGLLRLDILTVFTMPLYYILFYSIYTALKENRKEIIAVPTLMIFAGLTLFLAAPSVFSYLNLSDRFAASATEAERNQLVSAGEAIFASDIWRGTGPRIGGLLMQAGATIISYLMLKNNVFNKATAYTGIAAHGLDLLHIVAGFFSVALGNVIMGVSGVIYLAWFPLVGIRLFKLGKYSRNG